jgi:hypothetical protein
MTDDADRGVWGKTTQGLLPIWAAWPLTLLGMWFVLLPLGLGLDVEWEFYAVGMVGAAAFAARTAKRYRLTVLERGDGFWVYRLERTNRGRSGVAAPPEPTADSE